MLLSDLCVDYILGFTFRLLALFYYAKGIYEIHTNIYSLFCIEFTGIYSTVAHLCPDRLYTWVVFSSYLMCNI